MSRSLIEFLKHIKGESEYILRNTAGLTETAFYENETLTRAFCRSLEIIGEATKNLPEDFRKRYSMVPWRRMTGMRDVLIHDYFGINYEVVWNVVDQHIPDIDFMIGEIIERELSKHQK